MRKKANIPITILVFLVAVLITATLAVFLQNTKKVSTKINDARILNAVYFEETQTDFYVEKMIEEAMVASYGDKEIFLANFKEVLESYRKYEKFIPAFGEIEKQVNEDNVEIDNSGVKLRLSFQIEKRFEDKIVVSYLYKKEFRKDY